MQTPHEIAARARELIVGLCAANDIPTKNVFVGISGSLNVTFFGRKSAEDAAALFSAFADKLRVVEGFDPGSTTEIRNACRAEVKVWRVGGFLSQAERAA